ncbi:MAG: Bax inhibitor-1/YccA family protein [Bacteroidetes bacterium]|jgi:FtsH-binding integral membrane protein|nr:Bax inhibitor-1/YccA family protein [Bacteroidota bacterium]
MNNYYGNNWSTATGAVLSTSTVNVFLRRVLGIMAVGLAITGVIAYLLGQQLLADIQTISANGGDASGTLLGTLSGMGIFVMLLPLAFILVLSFGINKLSYPVAAVLFGLYAATMGVSLSFIFVVYTAGSIALTFFTTAAMFGIMSIIGLTTKVDLTKYSSYFMMALIGLVVVGLVNMFVGSSTLGYIYGAAGVIIFSALTAYDMQRIVRESGMYGDDTSLAKKASLMGALSLYLDFVNLFLFLLRFMGSSRE